MTAINTLLNSSLRLESTSFKRWSVQEYHRMSELGMLNPDERTELLAGHITLMAPRGTPHVTTRHLILSEPNQASPLAFPHLLLLLSAMLLPVA